MLVLSRREGESIRIGDDIRLVVVAIDGARVRLGIDAPAEVPILRDDAKRRTPPDEAEIAAERG